MLNRLKKVLTKLCPCLVKSKPKVSTVKVTPYKEIRVQLDRVTRQVLYCYLHLTGRRFIVGNMEQAPTKDILAQWFDPVDATYQPKSCLYEHFDLIKSGIGIDWYQNNIEWISFEWLETESCYMPKKCKSFLGFT